MFNNNLIKRKWMVFGVFALLALNSLSILQTEDSGIQSAHFSSSDAGNFKKYKSSVRNKIDKQEFVDSFEMEVFDGVEKHTVTVNVGRAIIKKGANIKADEIGKLFNGTSVSDYDNSYSKYSRPSDGIWSDVEVDGVDVDGENFPDDGKTTENDKKGVMVDGEFFPDDEETAKAKKARAKYQKRQQEDLQYYTIELEGLPEEMCRECIISKLMGQTYDDDDEDDYELDFTNMFTMVQKKNISSFKDLEAMLRRGVDDHNDKIRRLYRKERRKRQEKLLCKGRKYRKASKKLECLDELITDEVDPRYINNVLAQVTKPIHNLMLHNPEAAYDRISELELMFGSSDYLQATQTVNALNLSLPYINNLRNYGLDLRRTPKNSMQRDMIAKRIFEDTARFSELYSNFSSNGYDSYFARETNSFLYNTGIQFSNAYCESIDGRVADGRCGDHGELSGLLGYTQLDNSLKLDRSSRGSGSGLLHSSIYNGSPQQQNASYGTTGSRIGTNGTTTNTSGTFRNTTQSDFRGIAYPTDAFNNRTSFVSNQQGQQRQQDPRTFNPTNQYGNPNTQQSFNNNVNGNYPNNNQNFRNSTANGGRPQNSYRVN